MASLKSVRKSEPGGETCGKLKVLGDSRASCRNFGVVANKLVCRCDTWLLL